MHRSVHAILVWLTATVLPAQVFHQVQVLEYDGSGEKKPLGQVEVRVAGASSRVTDRDGRCTLRFLTAHPGDYIFVRSIYKPGYVVLNTETTDFWYLPSDDSPTTILMCREELLHAMEEKYMRSFTEGEDQRLQQTETMLHNQHAEGVLSQAEYERRIKQLYDVYEQRLKDIRNYIKRFTHIDLTAMNQEEQQIMACVNAGDIDGAIARYEEMDLLKHYRNKTSDVQQLSHADTLLQLHISRSLSTRKQLTAAYCRQLCLHVQKAQSLRKASQCEEARALLLWAAHMTDTLSAQLPDSLLRQPFEVLVPDTISLQTTSHQDTLTQQPIMITTSVAEQRELIRRLLGN